MGRTNLAAAAVAALVLAGAPLLAQGYSDTYAFLKGVRERDAAAVEGMVAMPNPAVVNARDQSSGEGALHILTRGRDYTWLSFLLGRGARVDLQSNDGTAPLHLAAQLGWREGAELLLSQQANPNIANIRGETPLILAVQRRDLVMVRLLLRAGGDPNQTDSAAGYSALDYARQDSRSAPILRELETARSRRGAR